MRVKVVAITPKKPPFASAAVAAAKTEEMLDDAAKEALGYYEKTTATWNTKVTFVIRKVKYGRSVGTRSRIYTYVDRGTRPHVIKPKGNYPLAFATGGRPKTRPNTLASYNGAPGKTGAFAREVRHPGTAARGFTAVIQQRMNKSMKRRARSLSKELAKG